jgi:hypothetical protein
VSYCVTLDLVLSAESHSSSNGSVGSESIMTLAPPALDVHISAELPCMTEAPEAEVAIATEVHTVSPEGWLLLFL